MNTYQNKESEVIEEPEVTLYVYHGWVRKDDLRNHVFGSKAKFLEDVAFAREDDEAFKDAYQKYYHAHRLPLKIATRLLELRNYKLIKHINMRTENFQKTQRNVK